MKKVLVWLLVLTMVLGLFAGCRNNEEDPTTAPTTPATTAPQVDTGLEDAIAYLKAWYKSAEGTETPVDFERFGVIRIAGVPYEVVWTVDVGEELIKIVKNEDGTVTIDVNEECEEDTPYVLTATITDGNGKSVSASWNHILPKAADMVAIVEAAYALAPGESLPYASTLRGKIISIDTIYSEEYKNISVTIAVTGAENKPIKCYRMKGEGIKDLAVGNIITVTGTLKNYNGTIEFDAGCMMDAWEQGDAVAAPTDPGTILKAAYALAQDASLPYVAELTGTVIEIDSPYDPNYGNISVVIQVEGYPQYPMLCYRLKGAEVDKIAVNDLITVQGIIKNYRGTIEYDAGCQMIKRVSGGGVAQGPSSDANKILTDAAKLAPGQKLPYRATLTGEIVSLDQPYDANYGNVTVTIKVNGVKIQCYRMVGNGADLIRVTDKITVSGIIENYNGKLEFGAKCTLDSWTMGPRVEVINYGPLQENTAYTMAMAQNGIGKNLYFNGKMSGNYLDTSEKASDAVEVYMEKIDGKGVRFFFLDGETKTYINIIPRPTDASKTYPSLSAEATCYFKYDADAKVYAVENSGSKFYLGTYGTFDTISTSSTYYISDGNASTVGKTQFVAEFIPAGTELPEQEGNGGEGGEDTVNYGPLDTSKTYNLKLVQANLGKTLYFNGQKSGNYLATTENAAEAVEIFVEKTEGFGIRFYFLDGTTKTYIDVTPRPTDSSKTYPALSTEPVAYFVYNTDAKVYAVENAGTWFYLGTYGTYNTISTSSTYYITGNNAANVGVSQFVAEFVAVGNAPDVPADDVLTVKEAIELGLSQEHNVYTTEKYKVTGVITEVYNAVYGNMKITDAEGNILTIYGTYSADGSTRYDAMEVKPVAGDTVTIYGIVGQYNNVAQIKNGWIVEHTPAGSTPDVPDEPAEDELTVKEAIELGLSQEHNVYTTEKYKVTGVITEVYNTTYGNMKITDAEGNILTIYGTYSADGSTRYDAMEVKPVAGDTVTVYGIVGQYNNVAQIKNGWIVEHTPAGSTPDVPDEPDTPDVPTGDGYVQITDASQFVSGSYVLVVSNGYAPTALDDPSKTSPWLLSGQPVVDNGVISVENAAGYVFTVTVNGTTATLTDANGNTLAPKSGNTNGIISGTYNWDWTFEDGTFKFAGTGSDTTILACNIGANGGYKFRSYKNSTVTGSYAHEYLTEFTLFKLGEEGGGNGGTDTPDVPVVPDEPAEDELTVKEAIELGLSQEHNVYTTEKYKVTGEITEVYNTTYGNMKITDAEGNILTIYGTYSADGSTRYDAMEVKPVAGDTVTVYGIVGQYNNVAQIKNGWIIEHTPAGSTPDVPDVPADDELTIAEALELGVAQGTGLYTTEKYKVTGEITEVYNTTYGNMKITDGNGNILTVYGTFSADGSTRYDAMEVKPVAGDTITVYGIVGNYNNVAQIKNGWIIEHTPAGSTPDVPDEPDTPDVPTGDGYVQITDASQFVSGSYVLVVSNGYAPTALDDPSKTSPWLLSGQPVVDNGVISVENAAGYVFTVTVNGTTATLTDANGNTLAPKSGNTNGIISGTYNWDWTFEDGTFKFAGTGSDTTILACNIGTNGGYKFRSYKNSTVTGSYAHEYLTEFTLFKLGEEGSGNGGNGGTETPDEPAEDELTVKEAIDLGLSQEHNVYTTEKYKVSGVITEVYNTTYGNMKITDAEGNILTIYGTYSADGSTRYDAMEVKPVAGDTVTVYGIVGQYNNVAQIKNGWIIEHTPAGSTPDVPDVPANTTDPVKPVIGTAYKFGMIQEKVSTTDIYYLKGGMSNYYMASSKNVAEAIDVYIEPTTGGYYLYTFVAGAKTYINMVVSGTHVNGQYSATASTVYTYDEEMQTFVTNINNGTYRFGTRNDMTYTTIGPVDVTRGNYYCKFYVAAGAEE